MVTTTSQPSLNQIRTVSLFAIRPVVIIPIRVNATKITFSRDSSRMTLPLVSTMMMEYVNSHLEGTGINSSSVSSVVLMKTIRIFDANRGGSYTNRWDSVQTITKLIQMLPTLLRLQSGPI